jgi:hypothetical protein
MRTGLTNSGCSQVSTCISFALAIRCLPKQIGPRFGRSIWTFAGSQLDHAFPAPDGSQWSRQDTKGAAFEFRRPLWNPRDIRGHAAHTVRDREDEVSNPSPPTIFVFEIGDFEGCLLAAAHRRVTISCEQRHRGGVAVFVVGQCEITWLQLVATQRPNSKDAQGRTVRHSLSCSFCVA